ncbi:MAG: hypothetical protein CYPHOPRED_002388 [Cyphobasidiales sp. Tagirdzhanova-0007]|nr:MAG: hypothetical protein CYPHOPRED_002388 [Cyphobasidiales sp. Tagirdzhanova-0007]
MICSGSSYANIVTVKYSGSSGSKIKRWQTLHRALSSSLSRVAPDKSRFILPEQQALFPKGFKAAATHCGIKKVKGALDLALVTSTTASPTSAAACFTKNVFQAAPVQVSRSILLNNAGRAQRVIVNSGCANAVTGKQGMEDAWTMSQGVDELTDDGGTLVMSTGVIGQNLPINKISAAIPTLTTGLSNSYTAWHSAARAFMTTDTFPKMRTKSAKIQGREVRFVGMDKGAGMIHPRMGAPHATLLGLIATDAAIEPKALQSALTHAIDRSFNSISVDGDMSTNDTVIAFANGASGAKNITSETSPEWLTFRDELTDFAIELAGLVVRDGEGATKFIKITVNGTPTYEDAHHIASVIARSPLVKTAMHGADANWGRILCAVGYSTPSSFTIDPLKVSVSFVPSDGSGVLRTLIRGEPQSVDEVKAKRILDLEDIEIQVDLEMGDHSAAYFTCDLSKDYIEINADYRS